MIVWWMHTRTRHLLIETCRAISKKNFTAILFSLGHSPNREGATRRSATMIAISVYQLNIIN